MTAVNDSRFVRHALLPALAVGIVAVDAAAMAQTPEPHVKVSLVAEALAIATDGKLQLALRQEIRPGWHTYWVNPGDSGLTTTIEWKLPRGFSADPIAWPTPELFRSGMVVNYGYEGDVMLPMTIAVPAGLEPGAAVTLSGHANWLACAEICVPASADVAVTLPVAAGAVPPDPRWADRFQSARAAVPTENRYPASVTMDRESIELHLAVDGADKLGEFRFFPFDDGVIDNGAEQRVETAPDGITVKLARGDLKAQKLDRLNGVLAFREVAADGQSRRRAVAISVPADAALSR